MTGSYTKYSLEDFARELEGNFDVDHLLMLGAGASRSSGVPTASECIWDWKASIYSSYHPKLSRSIDCGSEEWRQRIQEWLDSKGTYPEANADEEYEFFAEEAYKSNEGRRQYFESLAANKEQAVGYRVLALLAEQGVIRIVLTTNFDHLAAIAMNQNGLPAREVTIETSNLIHMPMRRRDCFHIALHGDYKYEKLKNTGRELDQQQEDFRVALRIHLYNKHLIVMGYSGRDRSLMDAIENAYLQEERGRGILYWCSHGDCVSEEVDRLLRKICATGRKAIQVVAGDFDGCLGTLAAHCFRTDPSMSSRVGNIVGYAGEEDGEVKLDQIEIAAPQPNRDIDRIAADIDRLDPDALKAAAKAALLGSWTESDADREVIEEATSES